jgi:lysozyme
MAKRRKKKKKSSRIWWYVIPIILFALTLGGYIWYRNYRIDHARFVRYPAFGIELPSNYQIHGIDVSHHQSFVHWPAVKEMQVKDVKIGFSFIKATEGLVNVDRRFKRNWDKAAQAKLPRGAYHFFITGKSGKGQAKNFINTVHLAPGDLPPVLDVEQLYGVKPAKMREQIKEWLEAVEEYYNVRPIIYTSANFYEQYLGADFDRYPLWVAHYKEKDKPRIKREWMFWQHSEEGRVNGITNKVDFNVFNGDSTDFAELLVK